MAQVEQACQLSAAEWQAVAEQAERDRAGYASAFYRIAEVLGIPAQANTPEAVFEREMLPALRASLSATGVPTQPSGWVLVPEEPTTAMLEAAYKAFQTAAPSLIGFNAKDRAYKAMLQHAPKPPAPAVAVIPERQGSVHPAAPSSPSDLRSAPFSEPSACESSELPVRPFKLNPPPIYDEHFAATQQDGEWMPAPVEPLTDGDIRSIWESVIEAVDDESWRPVAFARAVLSFKGATLGVRE